MADTLTRTEKIDRLKEWLTKTELDPTVTKDTVGMESSSITPRLLLASSEKLIKINKKEVEPDNRDSLKYSDFLGMEDFVKDHIEKDAGHLYKKAALKMQQKKNLDWLHANFFNHHLRGIIIGNTLTSNVDGINPMEHYDNSHRVTKMGEGGISDSSAIPDSSRQVETSSFGFFDPLHISESDKVGVTNYIAHNVVKGKDNKLYRIMKDKDGKLVWVSHEKILNSKVLIPEH